MSQKAVLFLNGGCPPQPILQRHLHSYKNAMVICADGGYRLAKDLPNLDVHVVIGDLDTIRREQIDVPASVTLLHRPSQELNDFEKALIYLTQNSVNDVLLLGASGGRTDHVLSNLALIQKYHEHFNFQILGQEAEISYVNRRGEYSFPAKVGQPISLVPWPDIHILNSRGLRYPLRNLSLKWPDKLGTSNEATAETIRIHVQSGEMFIFFNYVL